MNIEYEGGSAICMSKLNDETFRVDHDSRATSVPNEGEFDAERTQPTAIGDFAAGDTTLAVRLENGRFEVRLASMKGALLHFAVDAGIAGHLANQLQQELSARRHHLSSGSRPWLTAATALTGHQKPLAFGTEDGATVTVDREPAGDRIVVTLRNSRVTLFATVPATVALALREFFSMPDHPPTGAGA
jgi:hypothetical protein